MSTLLRRLLCGACLIGAMYIFTGCGEKEHRKVRMTEEQREGEVVEEAQGQEMIVE